MSDPEELKLYFDYKSPFAYLAMELGNLDVALNLPEADPKERQRIKEFVVLTAEALKTRELSDFLDALLTGEEDLFVKIEAPLESRLIACYQNVKTDPPINAEGSDRRPRLLIESPEKTAVRDKDAVFVHSDASMPGAR